MVFEMAFLAERGQVAQFIVGLIMVNMMGIQTLLALAAFLALVAIPLFGPIALGLKRCSVGIHAAPPVCMAFPALMIMYARSPGAFLSLALFHSGLLRQLGNAVIMTGATEPSFVTMTIIYRKFLTARAYALDRITGIAQSILAAAIQLARYPCPWSFADSTFQASRHGRM